MMKYFPKYLAASVGAAALGWAAYVMAQQPLSTQPPFNPATSIPAAQPSAAPAPGYSPSSASRAAAQRGVVLVPHGLVTAIDDVKIPARDAGAVVKLWVKGAEIVPANVILGAIDDRDTLAKMRIAQGELDAATAQYNSKAEIEAAKKGYEVANSEWESAKELRNNRPGAISLQELRRAEFQKDRAWAQIQVAETDNLVAGLTAKMKQAQLDATAIELGKKKIVSPIQGQIVEVYKHEGEWVQPGDPVLRLVRLDRVRVEGFVYAAEASPTDVEGKPANVKVYLPGNKETTLTGRVDFVSPLIEGSGRNRQYRVWAEVDNPVVDGHFIVQPGASAELQIDTLAAKIPAPQKEAPPSFDPQLNPGAAPVLGAPANNGSGARTEGPAAPGSVEALKPELPADPAANNPAPAPAAPAVGAPAQAAPAPAAARPNINASPATKAPATKGSTSKAPSTSRSGQTR
jgi:multidrug efflux pump subunit AcrA (membrane-fusion protein)